MAQSTKSYTPGVVLIATGFFLLLWQLGVLEVSVRELTPILLIALGCWFFYSAAAKKDRGAVFPGTIFLVLGLFFAVRNYGLFAFRVHFYDFSEYWPVFLIAFGLGFLVMFFVKPEDWGVLIPGSVLLFFGLVFLMRTVNYFYWRDVIRFWPLILIVIGISIIVSGLKHNSRSSP